MSTSSQRLLHMERWFNEDEASPIGRIVYGGYATHRGIPPDEMRVLGTYGLILLLEGTGTYLDAPHRRYALVPGSCIFLFPEMPHSYGPPEGGHWREFFLHFEGAAFDCWRSAGLLPEATPVGDCSPVETWLPRLESLARGPRLATAAASTGRICDFLKLLAQMTAGFPSISAPPAPWLQRVCDMLSDDLNEPLDLKHLAGVMGVSYSALRHRFTREMGLSPTAFRARKRTEAAGALLRQTDLSHRAIARRTGFADEFQFSRRFKQLTGISPSTYRRQSRSQNSGPLPLADPLKSWGKPPHASPPES